MRDGHRNGEKNDHNSAAISPCSDSSWEVPEKSQCHHDFEKPFLAEWDPSQNPVSNLQSNFSGDLCCRRTRNLFQQKLQLDSLLNPKLVFKLGWSPLCPQSELTIPCDLASLHWQACTICDVSNVLLMAVCIGLWTNSWSSWILSLTPDSCFASDLRMKLLFWPIRPFWGSVP